MSFEDGEGPDWDDATWPDDGATASFIVLKPVELPDDTVIEVEVLDEDGEAITNAVNMDDNQSFVARITDKNTQKIKMTATLDTFEYEKVFDLKQLDILPPVEETDNSEP